MSEAAPQPDTAAPAPTALVSRSSRPGNRRTVELVSEFQSDAVALEQRAPSRWAFTTLYLLTALIVGAVVWATVSRVDKIVVAHGKLVNTAPNLVVQPLETSVIRSIDVAAGDVVTKGQKLAQLDSTFTQADVEQLKAKVAGLRAKIDRLEAELAGGTYAAPADAQAEETLEARVFHTRHEYRSAQLHNFNEEISRAEASLETSLAEQAVLAQRLDRVREIEGMRAELIKRESGSRLNLLVSEDARLGVEASLAKLAGGIVELRHAAEKARAERAAFIAEFMRVTIEQLVEARNLYTAAAEELKKAALRRDMVVLTSPADAVVLDAAQRSVGSVVREAEALFTLVPLNVPLEAEVVVEAGDIGQVSVGQTVRLKLDAFPFQKHGTASGTLRTVSQDAFAPERRADQPDAASSPYFRARVNLTDSKLRGLPNLHLTPGMTVTAEIKTGDRRLISYFLYPLMRGFDESVREP